MDSAVTVRVRLPDAFAVTLAEAAASVGLTVSWHQAWVRFDAKGLHGSDLWCCQARALPVGVDDGKAMALRDATADMLQRLLQHARYVIADAEADERKAKRRDWRQKAADRAAGARAVEVAISALAQRMRETWPEEPASPA